MRVVTILDEILVVVVVVFHYTFGLPTRLMRGHFFYTLRFGGSKRKSIKCHPIRYSSTPHEALVK